MIRLWLSRGAPIPLREQLSAQLILGIVSGRLAPGERLPSVRELARRMKLHANTVSAAYQDLAKRGWVKRERGSGVFVRALRMAEEGGSVDAFVRAFVEDGLARGFSLDALEAAFGRIGWESRIQTLLVVDPDVELARIMAAEISEATGQKLAFAGLDDAAKRLTPDACVLVNQAHAALVRESFGRVNLRAIRLRSLQDMVAGAKRPASAVLIAVISRSESILQWASTLLTALGFPRDAVLLRNPRNSHWAEGLSACDIVSADVVSALELPARMHRNIFRVVSEEFLAEARTLVTAQKVS